MAGHGAAADAQPRGYGRVGQALGYQAGYFRLAGGDAHRSLRIREAGLRDSKPRNPLACSASTSACRGLARPGTSEAGRAALAARLGRSLALLGQEREARASLDHAIELANGQSADIANNVGIGLTDLGMPGRAGPYLATAVRLTASSPFLRSLYVARQAKTAIRARQPGQAAREMTALAGLAPLVESPRLTIHLRHIYDGTGQ